MKEVYESEFVMLYGGDNREVLSTFADDCIDAIVTDPPYELGFMGKTWDASGIAYDVAFWREVLRVLKPGGHMLAFGGTRTYHRMTCAIEDAGFEIRDSLHWIYGTGFPKSKNLGGLGTALKPAHEPIVMARKPLIGTVEKNLAAHGTGAINIDASRIGTSEKLGRVNNPRADGDVTLINMSKTRQVLDASDVAGGRWPANVLFDEDAAAELDAQSGERRSAGIYPSESRGRGESVTFGNNRSQGPLYADSGGASRFFYVAKPSRSERGATNKHPTVKPITLMRYLVKLVTPDGGLVLDPFAGSGTTLLAAQQEGITSVGIELNDEYQQIIVDRLSKGQK
jgi:DNA modification methylase